MGPKWPQNRILIIKAPILNCTLALLTKRFGLRFRVHRFGEDANPCG